MGGCLHSSLVPEKGRRAGKQRGWIYWGWGPGCRGVLLGAQLLALRGLVWKHGPAGVHARRVAAQGLLHDGALVGDRRRQR